MNAIGRRATWLLVAACLPACVTGCGSAARPIAGSVPVSGSVTFNGQPLEQGMVRFAPNGGKGQPATGDIRNGKFTMRTTASSPGVVVGAYKVSIISNKPFVAPTLAPGTPPDPNAPPPQAESWIPRKYNDVKTSGLTADVTGTTKTLAFELRGE